MREYALPIIEIFPISLDDACGLLEVLNDAGTTVEIFQVIEISNDIDPVHYRLRWEDTHHILENIWTLPIKGSEAKGWLAEHAAPDWAIHEWVRLWFMTRKAHHRFMTELMAAATLADPQPQTIARIIGP